MANINFGPESTVFRQAAQTYINAKEQHRSETQNLFKQYQQFGGQTTPETQQRFKAFGLPSPQGGRFPTPGERAIDAFKQEQEIKQQNAVALQENEARLEQEAVQAQQAKQVKTYTEIANVKDRILDSVKAGTSFIEDFKKFNTMLATSGLSPEDQARVSTTIRAEMKLLKDLQKKEDKGDLDAKKAKESLDE